MITPLRPTRPGAIRLAWFDIPAVHRTLDAQAAAGQPALLASYVFVKDFLQARDKYAYRDWIMDSGAYSAWNSGKRIDIEDYIATCHRLLASDPTLVEVIALDVINDGKTPRSVTANQSLKNAIYMREQGLEVVPVFHFGEDWAILDEYCARFHKVGLSCRFGEPEDQSRRFYDQCFARQWPKKFHSFGWISEAVVYSYPFHSGDSSSWEAGPCAFGNWQRFGKMSVPGANQDLRTQVAFYLEMEAKARVRWAKELAVLAALPAANPHVLRHYAPPVAELPLAAPAKPRAKRKAAEPKPAASAPAPVLAAHAAAPQPAKPAVTGVLDDKWKRNWWE